MEELVRKTSVLIIYYLAFVYMFPILRLIFIISKDSFLVFIVSSALEYVYIDRHCSIVGVQLLKTSPEI